MSSAQWEQDMPEVIINGPEGRLEGRYYPAKVPNSPIALLLHPHPQHGGTMNNKVVYQQYQMFVRRGFATLRFNFRGVGRSQGSFNRGEGELSDAASALDWLQTQNQDAPMCWVSGFSFGAWIGMQLLSFLAPCPASGLITHGDKDDIVPQESVTDLIAKLAKQKDVIIDFQVLKGATHFYNEHLDELEKTVTGYLDRRTAEIDAALAAEVEDLEDPDADAEKA
jgi:hypothetical protein